MELALHAVALTCGRCGATYRDAVPGGGYGRLVVRDTAGNDPAVADLMADPLVDLLGAVSAEHRALFGRVSTTAATDLQGAYLRLCDPPPSGLAWDRDATPACPACGGRPGRQELLEELVRVDLPVLRHDVLDALPRDEQRARAAAALRATAAPPTG